MSNWRPAKSLTTLLSQINELFPSRDKKSDGVKGDSAHSQRPSDHNPNSRSVVQAMDITHDAEGGVDCGILAEVLSSKRDPRIKYLIFNRMITQKGNVSAWKPYHGMNAHRHHLHISVNNDPKLYDDDEQWDLSGLTSGKINPADNIPPAASLIQMGAKGADVRAIQQRLVDLKFLPKNEVDGDFGARTAKAVKDFQTAIGLGADGIVGQMTKKRLFDDLANN